MRRREFLKTLAAGAAVLGFAGVASGSTVPGGPLEPEPCAPAAGRMELPIRGDPYTLSSGATGEARGAASEFGADPVVAYGLPAEWQDRYVLGIQV